MENEEMSPAHVHFIEQLFSKIYKGRLPGESLFGALARLGTIEEKILVQELAQHAGIKPADESFESAVIEAEVLNLIPGRLARRLHAIPVSRCKKTVTVVISDPLDQSFRDNLAFITGCAIVLVVAPERVIDAKIAECYPGKDTDEDELFQDSIPKTVNKWLSLVIEDQNCLCVEPFAGDYLVTQGEPPVELADLTAFDGKLVLARLKIMAGLEVGEGVKERATFFKLSFGKNQQVIFFLEIFLRSSQEGAVVKFVSQETVGDTEDRIADPLPELFS